MVTGNSQYGVDFTAEELANFLGTLGLGLPQPPRLDNKQRKKLLEDYQKNITPSFDENYLIDELLNKYMEDPIMIDAMSQIAQTGVIPDEIKPTIAAATGRPLTPTQEKDLDTYYTAALKKNELEAERFSKLNELALSYGLVSPTASFNIPEQVVKEYFVPKGETPTVATKPLLAAAAFGLLGGNKDALTSVRQGTLTEGQKVKTTKEQLERLLAEQYTNPFTAQVLGAIGRLSGMNGAGTGGGGGAGGWSEDMGAPPPRSGNYMGEDGRMFSPETGKRYATWEEVAHGYDPELDVMYRDVTPTSRPASDVDYTRAKKYLARRYRI